MNLVLKEQTPKRFSRGFTLIELLVVIAIIGLLGSIVFASLGSARESARDARRALQSRQFERALETHFILNGAYPCSVSGCGGGVGPFTSSSFGGAPLISAGVISSIPSDPIYPDAGSASQCNSTGRGYCYCSNGVGYVLTVNTENDKGGSDRCYMRGGSNAASLCTGHQDPGTWATQPCYERF